MAHEKPAYVRVREAHLETRTKEVSLHIGGLTLTVTPVLGTLAVHLRGPSGVRATRVLYRDDAHDLADALGAMLEGE